MEAAKNTRKTLKSRITKLKTDIEKYETAPPPKSLLQVHSEKLQKLKCEVNDNWESISGLSRDDAEYDSHKPEFESMDDRLDQLDTIVRDKLEEFNAPPRPTGGNPRPTASSVPSRVKLPAIELPTFSGDIKDWLSFHDLFKATIDSDVSLTKAQKLQYLKTQLNGDAARLLGSVQVLETNYDSAWQTLIDRYQNEREIILDHMNRIINQPRVKEESATSLRNLIDLTRESYRALEALQREPANGSDWLVTIILSKLDNETRRAWELSLKDKMMPSFDALMTFIEQHAQALGTISNNKDKGQGYQHKYNTRSNDQGKTKSHFTSSSSKQCPICSADHSIFKCDEFIKKSVDDRRALVAKKSLCYNCLKKGHSAAACTGGTCQQCQKKHHTTLHFNVNPKAKELPPSNTTQNHSCSHTHSSTLLPTALVSVRDNNGHLRQMRVFLDSGSEGSFISHSSAKLLKLPKKKVNISVQGLSATAVATARDSVTLSVKSMYNDNYEFNVNALILPKVTGSMPSQSLDSDNLSYLNGLHLADPGYNRPGPIDILLGADILADIIMNKTVRGQPHQPIALLSKLGWIIMGRTSANSPSQVQCNVTLLSLDEQVHKWWELEEVPCKSIYTQEEQLCIDHFQKTHKRNSDGRYVVELPFRDNVNIGDSKTMALKRFYLLEKRLNANSNLKEQYLKFMQEYIDLGHMSKVPFCDRDLPSSKVFYLPHHCVLKEASTSTKLRVVFDGSAKSSSSLSLNECLMVGPTIQRDLFSIMLRFRRWKIAIIADIVKMYRQILVSISHSNYQRILWRFSANDPVEDYNLLTVTYGTASAPYLATQALQQLARDESSKFSQASEVILNDMYVDDLMTGANTQQDATKLCSDLRKVTESGGMQFSKWVSNDINVLKALPSELRGTQDLLDFNVEQCVKALGVQWNPNNDHFQFCVCEIDYPNVISKRFILSDTAKVFDPAGWLSPVTVVPKMFLQRLWREKLSWDDQLSEDLSKEWMEYRSTLHSIVHIKIPRSMILFNATKLQLHGFSDASEKCYAACIYIRSESSCGNVQVSLVNSKTKVAPLKAVSLPRLELCGALLLTKLMTVTCECLELVFSEVHAWCDSTIVLDWIRNPTHRWKSFVANRVTDIHRCNPTPTWHHVSGKDNPADCASRGITPSELQKHPLWWTGPEFLKSGKFQAETQSTMQASSLQEARPVKISSHHCRQEFALIERYSDFSKLIRHTAWMRRYFAYFKNKQANKSALSVSELQCSLYKLISISQFSSFAEEYRCLESGKSLSKKSKLLQLNPQLDDYGCMRVGGRLDAAEHLTNNFKHPAILSPSHRLTGLLISHLHVKYLHAGKTLLLKLLQQQYWILGAKNAVKTVIRTCIVCARQRPITLQQQMGHLPKPRITPSRPFTHCGVDYAGPLVLRIIKGRSNKTFKCYVSLFICLATKAIHLEAVTDLTTDAFIAALDRFVSRRGKPTDMYSDQGSNFIGARKEIHDFYKLVLNDEHNAKVSKVLSEQGIQWHFNPPSAPHMGGLWEAGVKSMKYHLKRIGGSQSLTFEELSTVLCKIEACLNSRPLCPISDEIDNYDTLTPGHFLIGSALVSVPTPDYSDLKMNRLSRWQLTQRLVQDIWKRWQSEYLSLLQTRQKWTSDHPDLKIGSLVLVKDERLPPQQWLMARIVKLHPGKDNKVRVVTLKTQNGEFQRPIVKLCPLPFEDEGK